MLLIGHYRTEGTLDLSQCFHHRNDEWIPCPVPGVEYRFTSDRFEVRRTDAKNGRIRFTSHLSGAPSAATSFVDDASTVIRPQPNLTVEVIDNGLLVMTIHHFKGRYDPNQLSTVVLEWLANANRRPPVPPRER